MTSPLYIPHSRERIIADGIKQMAAFVEKPGVAEIIGNLVVKLGNAAEANFLPDLNQPTPEPSMAGENMIKDFAAITDRKLLFRVAGHWGWGLKR